MRRLPTALVALLALTFGLASTAMPANASDSDNEFDVYGLHAADLKITSGSCRYIAVSAHTNANSDIGDVTADVDLWLGSRYIGSISLSSTASVNQLEGSYYFCPGLDDPGTYRLGQSQVSWYTSDYERSGEFVDASTGKLVAKQALRFRSLKANKKGKTRTFTVHAQYFGAGWDSGWYNFPKGTKVYLQRLTSNGSGSWTTVKTAKAGKKGAVKFKVSASKVRQYRVYSSATNRSWNGHSATIRK